MAPLQRELGTGAYKVGQCGGAGRKKKGGGWPERLLALRPGLKAT